MAILIDEKKRVLVQGITGREGRARTRLMREYGTNVVGGVTPGKGGQSVLGVPVFNTPQEAVNSLGHIDVSVGSLIGVLATIAGTLATKGYPVWIAWLVPILAGIAVNTCLNQLQAEKHVRRRRSNGHNEPPTLRNLKGPDRCS